MKKMIIAILCMMIVIIPFGAMAAPEFVGTTYEGNTVALFTVLNPDSFSTTTSNSTCIVSAAGTKNSTMAVYLYDASTGMYRKINTYVNDVKQNEKVVGVSGLYAEQVLLRNGLNKILVYAQLGSAIQAQRLEVTLVSDKFGGNLKAYVMGK